MDKHDREDDPTVNNEEKRVIINKLKTRLQWYTYEATIEEFDAKEVQAIVELLKEMDPIDIEQTKFNPQSGIKRLWKHCEKTKSETIKENNYNKRKFEFFHKNRGFIGAVVTASIVLMVFWGTSSSTMADLDTGFFHWLKMGKTGQETVLFPTQEVLTVEQSDRSFQYTDEELPQQYKDEMWIPDNIGENWDVQLNDVTLGDLSTTINRNYYNASADQKMQIQVKIYTNQLMFEKKSYADFTYLYQMEVAGTTMFYFEKQGEDEVEHAIRFYKGIRCYSVQGDTVLEKIEEIVTEYAHVILGNDNK